MKEEMKLIWITDIHFDFPDRTVIRSFLRTIRQAAPDAVLIGGDIGQAPSVASYLHEIESQLECPIYFVLGNHDFYNGSILEVRQTVGDITSKSRYLRWLNYTDVVPLSEGTALVGHDSWGDGRLGDFYGSSVSLNDFRLIKELTGLSSSELLRRLNALGDEAAEHFRRVVPDALGSYRHVVVLTHVPPFVEAAWYDGHCCNDEYLPFFSCKAVGEVLREAMIVNPNRAMTVLCGHTHGSGEAQLLPNLQVFTGGTAYGNPRIQQVLEVD